MRKFLIAQFAVQSRRRTTGQSGEICKETSPHCQCYLFVIKWFWCIHVGLLKSIRPQKVTTHWLMYSNSSDICKWTWVLQSHQVWGFFTILTDLAYCVPWHIQHHQYPRHPLLQQARIKYSGITLLLKTAFFSALLKMGLGILHHNFGLMIAICKILRCAQKWPL